MAEFTVTAATVKEKADELGTRNEQLKKEIETLNQLVSTLSTMWEGTAHDAFDAKYNMSRQKMVAFVNEITEYRNTLEEVAYNYNESERRNIEVSQG